MMYCTNQVCKEELDAIARECAEIIQKHGINAYDAQSIPEILKAEIERDNWQKLCTEPFKVFTPDPEVPVQPGSLLRPLQSPQ